jgi:hypothetical protein
LQRVRGGRGNAVRFHVRPDMGAKCPDLEKPSALDAVKTVFQQPFRHKGLIRRDSIATLSRASRHIRHERILVFQFV